MQDNKIQQMVLNKLESVIKENNIDLKVRVLDMGCSDVRLYSKYLIDNAEEYVGIDINENSIKKAKSKFNSDNINFELTSSEDICSMEKTFDLIIINNSLAYTNKRRVINNIFQVLKEDGYCISLYNNTYLYNIYKIIHPNRNRLIEIIHSLVVTINMILYHFFSIRLFHTTSNSFIEITSLLNKHKFKKKEIIRDKKSFSWEVIHFIVKK